MNAEMLTQAHDIREHERLQALYSLELLDTECEPEFDELVQLAAAICGAPVSLISMVDEHRQWFKAAVGCDLVETSREVAFCDHAIRQSGLMLVEDATKDPRFRSNPLVTAEAGIRFYAGVPLSGPEGHPVGTLCVIDSKPRTLSEEQRFALRILANQVNARLELRVQRRALKQALADLEAANRRLNELASVDALTGLMNRRVFDERLKVAFRQAKRAATPLSLLLLDVDCFKQHNDRFGHTHGDNVLRELGPCLQNALRADDLAARYGGEEFAVLLPGTEGAIAKVLAERLAQAVRSHFWKNAPVTVSIGVSSMGPATPDTQHLVRAADQALYEAKRAGRDRVVTCSSADQEAT